MAESVGWGNVGQTLVKEAVQKAGMLDSLAAAFGRTPRVPWAPNRFRYGRRPPLRGYSSRPGPGGTSWRGRRPRRKSKKNSLSKRLAKIEDCACGDEATYVDIVRTYGTEAVAIKVSNAFMVTGSSKTSVESSMSALPYYDPKAPGTFDVVNYATATQAKTIKIASMYSHLHLKSNFNVPTVIDVWLVVPLGETSITPLVAWDNGLADIGTYNGSTITKESNLVKPSDSYQFKMSWKVLKHRKRVLKAGESMYVNYVGKGFRYNPPWVDSESVEYHGAFNSHVYLVRIHGVIGHDASGAVDVGQIGAGVDYEVYKKTIIKYDAGAPLYNTRIVDTQGDILSTAVTNIKPTTEKRSYTQG